MKSYLFNRRLCGCCRKIASNIWLAKIIDICNNVEVVEVVRGWSRVGARVRTTDAQDVTDSPLFDPLHPTNPSSITHNLNTPETADTISCQPEFYYQ